MVWVTLSRMLLFAIFSRLTHLQYVSALAEPDAYISAIVRWPGITSVRSEPQHHNLVKSFKPMRKNMEPIRPVRYGAELISMNKLIMLNFRVMDLRLITSGQSTFFPDAAKFLLETLAGTVGGPLSGC